jgi:hypothetical protein
MASRPITAEEAVRQVVALPAPRRAAALRELLRDDAAALARAMELLPTSGTRAQSALDEPAAAPEVRIGHFHLRSVLGEGGFGVVWLAEQDEPLRRSVAFKILRPDRLDAASRERFESERRMVALLDHPGLVKVFDAGEAPDGRPWFAMELAAGAPITQACDVAGLPIGARIDLMALVARAVHHAHQRGVIHRDLKPSNILVSLDADEPRVKVIDFGVARAAFDPMNPDERDGAIVGTPGYMAPESRGLRSGEADPRMDVYALGAVLLRLLADCAPLDGDALSVHARFNRLPRDERRRAAANRSATPAAVASALRGDLDAIVARCLDRDPRRRYDSALALAQDLECFRRGEPVRARPDTLPRRAARAWRRHFVAIVLAAAAVAAVSASAAKAWQERARALAAKDRTEIMARNADDAALFITELLAEIAATPGVSPRTAQQILAEASRLVGLRLNNDPLMEARVRTSMGRLWSGLQRDDLAAQEFSRAVALLQSGAASASDAPRLLAETELPLAASYRAAGRFGDAKASAALAQRQFEAEQPPDADDVARSLLELARIAVAENRRVEALELLVQARASLDRAPEPSPALAQQIQWLADSLQAKPPAATTP